MLWLRKLFTLVFLATGITLLILQFPDSLEGERTEKALLLDIKNTPYSGESASKRLESGVVELSDKDFMDFPGLKAELQRLLKGPIPNEEIINVTQKRWLRFQHRVLDQDEFRPSFIYNGKLFISGVTDQLVSWTLETPWLWLACKILGAVAILIGILIGFSGNRLIGRMQGIPVAATWLSVFCNTILLAGAIFSFMLIIDAFWIGVLGQPSLLDLDPEWPGQQTITGLHFVSIPASLIVLPLLSLWFTSLAGQRILVDEKGITSFGSLGSIHIEWSKLKGIKVEEQRNPFSFTAFDFQSLQRILSLESDDIAITINQPSSRRRKRIIIHNIKQYAPQEKCGIIKDLDKW